MPAMWAFPVAVVVALAWVVADAWRCHRRIERHLAARGLERTAHRWPAPDGGGEVVMPHRLPPPPGHRLCAVIYAQRGGRRYRLAVWLRGWLWLRRLVFAEPEPLAEDGTVCDGVVGRPETRFSNTV